MASIERYRLLEEDLKSEFGLQDVMLGNGLVGVQVNGRDMIAIDRPDLIIALKRTVERYKEGLSGLMKFYSIRELPHMDAVIVVFYHPSFEMPWYPNMQIYNLETNHVGA